MNDADRRLLVVEDEEHLAGGLKLNFELEGFDVDVARTARDAGRLLVSPTRYSAIVLDVMLPDVDGFSLCRKIRETGNYTPVLMLTARASADDRVRGLEAGADDYMVKPFDLDELIARVRSLLRRRSWDLASDEAESGPAVELEFGSARVNFDTHEAVVGEEPISLTRLEVDLLRYFAENPGRVLSRRELMENVWKLGNYPSTRTVDNFVLRLRKQFEADPARPVHFVSVRGLGYRFVPEADRDDDESGDD